MFVSTSFPFNVAHFRGTQRCAAINSVHSFLLLFVICIGQNARDRSHNKYANCSKQKNKKKIKLASTFCTGASGYKNNVYAPSSTVITKATYPTNKNKMYALFNRIYMYNT
ncbi:unnamed protein product [Ixodes pacificus]